ncbi:MAG: helix-turn-helix domain-containing protein [Candidatus Dormibacteraceae bacterium]
MFRLSLDEHRDLLQKVTRARALKPSAKLLLAATCSGALMLAELIAVISAGINSIARIPSLTPREHQVLCEIRSGLTNREIAAVLGISLSTANRHVENILRKLSVRNRAQAVAKCESIGSEQAGKVAVH